jgi:thiamine biosynthesis lipoprotein
MARRLVASVLVLVLAACLLVLALVMRSPHGHGVHPSEPGPDAGEGAAFRTFEGEAMATTIRATLPAGPSAEASAEAVFDVFRRVDAEMSEWKETSPLSEVNRQAGGAPVAVPAELLDVVGRGLEIGDVTEGAFDVTWAALWGLWDFRAAEPEVPPAGEIAAGAALVDYRKVEVDETAGTLRLPEAGMKIGLGGIAKGYALERAAVVLRERGLTDFLLVSGGQVYAAGRRGDRPWRVGIRDPRGGPGDFFAQVDLTDGSLSTSGDYERYFIEDGVRYHHILDPATGRPARGLRSATVLAADAVLADALSTGIFVLGPERGLALAERLDGVEAVLVDDEGNAKATPGLQNRLEILHPPAR